jgi:hypothetical protein
MTHRETSWLIHCSLFCRLSIFGIVVLLTLGFTHTLFRSKSFSHLWPAGVGTRWTSSCSFSDYLSCPSGFLGGCSPFLFIYLLIYFLLSRVSLILPSLSRSFTYLNDSLVIPRSLSRHLHFPSDYPTSPSPASIARYIHLGFVFWYREISICCAGIGYSASSWFE